MHRKPPRMPSRSIRVHLAVLALGLGCLAAPAAAQMSPHLIVRNQIEEELLNSAEMRDALKAAAAARRDYDYIRNRALAELERVGDYRALRIRHENLQAELDDLYFEYRYGIPPRERVTKLAREIYKLGKQMAEFEARALDTDRAVREAKADLVAAGRTLITLRREIPDRIRSDPRFRRAARHR